MKTSVIIPTFNREDSLMRTLQSLQVQTLDDFEIIVVDNAANRKIAQVIMEFNKTARINANYMAEQRLGVHYARNTGAIEAKGEVLLYTDDDVTFASRWVEAYEEEFREHPEMAAAGGPVAPIWEAPPPQWIIEHMADRNSYNILSLRKASGVFRITTDKEYYFSCNMAIRKDILKTLGGFHPEATGTAWVGDGESGLNFEMWKRRDPIGYVPKALVYHHIPRSRMTVKYFRVRMANEGAAKEYTFFHKGIPGIFSLFKYAMGIIFRNSKAWINAVFLKDKTDMQSLKIQLEAAQSFSRFRYCIRLMVSKDFRKFVLKHNWIEE